MSRRYRSTHMVCHWCSGECTYRNSKKKYCSAACRQAAYRYRKQWNLLLAARVPEYRCPDCGHHTMHNPRLPDWECANCDLGWVQHKCDECGIYMTARDIENGLCMPCSGVLKTATETSPDKLQETRVSPEFQAKIDDTIFPF